MERITFTLLDNTNVDVDGVFSTSFYSPTYLRKVIDF